MAPGERIVPRSSSACHQAGSLREATCMHNETGTFGESSLGFTLPRADHTEKVPQRVKAPDFSNSDVQRATLAIHSSVGFFFCFFVCLFVFYSNWLLGGAATAELLLFSLGPLAKEPPDLSISIAPREQRPHLGALSPEVS